MRLLFVNHNVSFSGGTFFRAYHIGRFLIRRGHAVTLLTISRNHWFRFAEHMRDGVRIVESPDVFFGSARSGWDPWDTIRRIGFIGRDSYDLVHAFDSRPAVILPALAAKRRGSPLVLDWADWWGRGGTIEERQAGRRVRTFLRPVETFFEEAFRTHADGTTVISRALEERARELGVLADSIARIPQGSDVEAVTVRPQAAARAAVGIGEGPLLGYLGVLPRSDATLLFSAFAAVAKRRPGCKLVLIGNHRSVLPPLDGLLQTGFVDFDRMVTWLGACDLLLLPLKNTIASRGRWPSKFNDYLAAGRPVVATDVGDVPDFFARWELGRPVTDTPEAFAEAIDYLFDDPAERERLGLAARRAAEEALAWTKITASLEDHYSRVLERCRGQNA